MMRWACIVCCIFSGFSALGQTLGGATGFNFAKLSNCPQRTGLGGLNISNISTDIGLAYANPGLLRPEMNGQILAVFNTMRGNIRNYHLMGGYYAENWKTSFAGAINYFNYGELPQTDAAGNQLGSFRPVDYVIQVSAGRAYLNRWHYGVTLKWLHSGYGIYRFSALALDMGLTYSDTANLWQAALLLQNMGATVGGESYGGSAGELPFDIQAGITKELAHAPIRFSLTAHHLHQFDLQYRDTLYNNENGFSTRSSSFPDKLFRHLVLSTELLIDKKVELSLGYDYLLRQELNIGNAGNGLNGFSMGIGLLFRQWQFRYARTYYQNNTEINQVGINLFAENWFK